jgi:c(7)-type cytochrome triheme protein
MRAKAIKKTNSALFSALFVFLGLVLVSCSSSTRSLFFDIQPSKPKPIETEETQTPAANTQTPGLSFVIDQNGERPSIEDATNWEDALEMLPKDYKKKADWSAALDQGLVRPRTGTDPLSQYATMFQYDFIIASEKPKNEAYFPHSAHTEWLGCKNCHTAIYPYKRNPATMKEMRKGASCGTCHGNVAFSLKQCKRCHLNR